MKHNLFERIMGKIEHLAQNHVGIRLKLVRSARKLLFVPLVAIPTALALTLAPALFGRRVNFEDMFATHLITWLLLCFVIWALTFRLH